MCQNVFNNLPEAYELKQCCYVEEIHGLAALISHKKTKARLLLVSNEDTNKVFNIGFRTPVYNDTGVPHIIEHTVLCGSKNFPAKDPFVELVKGSLNTFLNAMTYADKTMYPVASYNDKDFMNLMHVYMDAVFYPNIYKNPMIFEQEGWHYELENEQDDLKINGVVYNEMKGAFSSPEQLLFREISSTLFPDTNYSSESGGDPDAIWKLTYEDYLDFHRTYYHPSNSYIYLYGDFDVDACLEFMDKNYLADFEYKNVDSHIEMQPAFDKMRSFTKKYSIGSDESADEKAYFSYNVVIGNSLDKKLYVAFQILEYVLMSAPGAVLKKALMDAQIGKDVFGSYDNGILQPYMSVVAKDADINRKDEFMQIIRTTLENLVKEGINKKSLEGALNYFEFKFREADFGRWPKGLMYGLQLYDSWLYDETQPLMHLQAFDTFAELRKELDTDYFERLIETYLLNNTHASLLVLEPEQGLSSRNDEAMEKMLAEKKANFSKEEIKNIIRKTEELKIFQETPSTPEELEMIPMIEISDIRREVLPLNNHPVRVENLKVLRHDVETNGINYFKVLFDIKGIGNELLPYLGLLSSVLGNMNTKYHTYMELTDEINMYTGGISTDLTVFNLNDSYDAYRPVFITEGKALYERSEVLAKLIKEMLFETDFSDTKRLKEIIGQLRSRLAMFVSNNGHSAAAMRATSYYNEASWFKDMTGGIGFYEFIKKLDDNFEELKNETVRKLNQVRSLVFRQEHVMFDLTSKEAGLDHMKDSILSFEKHFCTENVAQGRLEFEPGHKNEGILTPGMVQYDAVAGNFGKKGFKYHGALQILKVIMNYDYLWNNIRVKGGAYGCMSNFTLSGNAYFVTYRDPNLKESFEIFKGAGEYIRNFDCSQRDMTKYIIGAISNSDTPLTPSGEGARSLGIYMIGSTYDIIQQRRNELLDATVEDIRSFGDLIDAFVDENYICVVGSERQIKANEDMFAQIKSV